MKLHKEAFPTLFYAIVIFLFFNVAMWRLFYETPLYYQLLFGITSALLLITFLFFRVPIHNKPIGKNKISAPAYGTVVSVEPVFEKEYFKNEMMCVSIFMSPLNIHCNYVPMAGKITYFNYVPGKYLMAFHPKSSELNEHTSTVIKGEKTELLVKQIAGFMARRIKPYMEEGMQVKQNDELGFIKFGSRVDVFLPVDTDIKVKVGDKTKGARTVLAKL